MFDIGGIELLIIGIVALLVMGDDFPTMFRNLGRFTGKMRKMAREFSRAMEEAADDAGVNEVAKSLKTATSPKNMGLDALKKATDNLDKWEAGTKSRIKPEGTDGVASDKAKGAAAEKSAEIRATAGAAMSKAAVAARDAAAAEPAAETEPTPPTEADAPKPGEAST